MYVRGRSLRIASPFLCLFVLIRAYPVVGHGPWPGSGTITTLLLPIEPVIVSGPGFFILGEISGRSVNQGPRQLCFCVRSCKMLHCGAVHID